MVIWPSATRLWYSSPGFITICSHWATGNVICRFELTLGIYKPLYYSLIGKEYRFPDHDAIIEAQQAEGNQESGWNELNWGQLIAAGFLLRLFALMMVMMMMRIEMKDISRRPRLSPAQAG